MEKGTDDISSVPFCLICCHFVISLLPLMLRNSFLIIKLIDANQLICYKT